MVSPIFSLLAIPAALIPLAAARTDLTGCTRTDVSSPAGASYAWYVPGTGETCDFLDCGGGTAPPNYEVPGCPQYTGTATYSPSYLAGYSTTGGAVSASTAAASASATASATALPSGYVSGDDPNYYDYGDDGSDYDDGDDDIEEDDDYYSTAVWRTADNPTATIHPYLATSLPSGISTYWVPVEIETGGTTWEEVIYTTGTDGYDTFVPASTPAASDLPAICAIATNSGCGMTTSTISIPGKTISGSAVSATGSQNATSSLTKTFVQSIPSGLESADEVSGGNSTASASASATPSQGAAAGLERTFGAVGLLAAAFGALIAL